MIRAQAAAALVVALALLSGCGSGGSGGLLSRDALDHTANKICTRANTHDNLGLPPIDFRTDTVALVAYLQQVVPIAHSELNALSALRPEKSLQAQWNAFLGLAAQSTLLLDTTLAEAQSGHLAAALPNLDKLGSLTGQISDASTRIGATACIQG